MVYVFGVIEPVTAGIHTQSLESVPPVCVVGVRTSGSYLAPLLAGSLRLRGRPAEVSTLRPGQRWTRAEARRLRGAASAGATAVLVDDPPRSWSSVARADSAVAE